MCSRLGVGRGKSAGRGDSSSACGQRTQEPAATGQTYRGEATACLILKKTYSSFENNLLGKLCSWGFCTGAFKKQNLFNLETVPVERSQ